METGTVIPVRLWQREAPAGVEVLDEEDLRGRYERLVSLVLRVGCWLNGPQARLLSPEEWESHFVLYQERLAELRRLGDELRPVSLRERSEPLSGDALVTEVLELFAA